MRVLVIVLALMLLVMPVLAEINLSLLTLEEVVELQNDVSLELSNRGVPVENRLYKGTYIIGVDIPSGKYIFKGTDSTSTDSIYIRIIDLATKDLVRFFYTTIGAEIFLTLEEGWTFELGFGGGIIRSFDPLWSPK